MIDFPIARKDGSIIERCVDLVRGENAITNYVRLNYNPELDISLVKCRLLTGRTHQIRVHFAYIGHPLLGDSLYGLDCVGPSNVLLSVSQNNGLCGGFGNSYGVSDLYDVKSGVLNGGVNLNGVTPGALNVGVDKCDFEKSKADLINHQALQSNRVCFIHPISKEIIDIGLDINGIYKELFE